jgi:23S rRNA pseudouridine2605 synthase
VSTDPSPNNSRRVRLQRYLADAGIAARRACEVLIERGHVNVNGKLVRELPAFVDPEHDSVTVDGRPVQRPDSRKIYVMLNKPARVLGTTVDEPGGERTTVRDLVDHPSKARLVPVGRLGYETMGLVLLTNDGELVNRLTHPRYGVSKTYRAVVKGTLASADIEKLEHELNRLQRKDDRRAARVAPTTGRRVKLTLIEHEPGKTLLAITLNEGKTGDLAQMLTTAGAPVRVLERIAIGPVELTSLARGRWRELEPAEIKRLKAAARHAEGSNTGGRKPDIETGEPTIPKGPRRRQPIRPVMPAPTLTRKRRSRRREM